MIHFSCIFPGHDTSSRCTNRLPGGWEARLFDDLFLEALDKRDHVTLFGLGHLELRQGRGRMTEEHVPVALADAHASVGEHHVPAAVVHRPARARAEEVDQELLLALDAVLPAMRPEAAELRIGPEPGQQIIRHCRDCVVTTKALVKGLLLVAHRFLLYRPNAAAARLCSSSGATSSLCVAMSQRCPKGSTSLPYRSPQN